MPAVVFQTALLGQGCQVYGMYARNLDLSGMRSVAIRTTLQTAAAAWRRSRTLAPAVCRGARYRTAITTVVLPLEAPPSDIRARCNDVI